MKKVLFLILLTSLICGNVFAQYKVYTWENFETGQYPSSLQRINNATESNVKVLDYRTSPDAAKLMAGNAKTECGNFGLIMTSNMTTALDILSVVGNVEQDRSALGAKGKAIVQADFFVPSDIKSFHFASLVAKGKESKDEKTPTLNYRLGFSPEDTLFFSTYDSKTPDKQAERKNDPLSKFKLKRPGWHRLQMVFVGQDKIYLYIDGIQPSYSPIQDSKVKYFTMGLMMAANPKVVNTSIVDNLSIQTSLEDDAELPISPWNDAAPALAVAEGQVFSGIRWFNNTDMAFNFNKTKNMDYLLLFYFPSSKLNQQLEQNMAGDPNSTKVFGNFCNIRLDVNQLAAGQLAERYNVVKFPTIIIVDPRAKEKRRIMYYKNTPWNEVLTKIANQ